MIIRPAYGRSYNTAEEVWNDWNANKDFVLVYGPYTYINSADYEKYCDPTLDSIAYSYNDLYVPINTGILI